MKGSHQILNKFLKIFLPNLCFITLVEHSKLTTREFDSRSVHSLSMCWISFSYNCSYFYILMHIASPTSKICYFRINIYLTVCHPIYSWVFRYFSFSKTIYLSKFALFLRLNFGIHHDLPWILFCRSKRRNSLKTPFRQSWFRCSRIIYWWSEFSNHWRIFSIVVRKTTKIYYSIST